LSKPTVFVITSHVVRGAVGGRASDFALERLGFPIWSLPTIVLPWHPGQGRATRLRFGRAPFASAVSELAASPALGEIGAILTGYFGDAGQIEPVAEMIAVAKARNPELIYLCDPVIGDGDGLFQPPEVAAAIRDRLIPLADIATPNRHELMWLARAQAVDNDGLTALAAKLGPAEVAVTSAFAPAGETGVLLVDPGAAHVAMHVARSSAPHGTGDLFAALYLAHSLGGAAPAVALERATAGTLRLVDRAAELGADELPLADAQAAFGAEPRGVTVVRHARAGG
jgi:pyridoxine kinase